MSARKQRKSGGKAAPPKDQPADLLAEKSEEAKEVKGTKDGGFAKGGKTKHRPDRKPRASGGRTGSPFTSAHMLKTPGNSGAGQGHEDDGPKGSELSD